VNTQSIASASGFASLLPSQIETPLSVGADAMSKQFGQFSKQQRQGLVNLSILMSMVAILAPGSQIQSITVNLGLRESDLPGLHHPVVALVTMELLQ
jgi:hypothetical protein